MLIIAVKAPNFPEKTNHKFSLSVPLDSFVFSDFFLTFPNLSRFTEVASLTAPYSEHVVH